MSVSDGVKLGWGAFVVLPLLVIFSLILLSLFLSAGWGGKLVILALAGLGYLWWRWQHSP